MHNDVFTPFASRIATFSPITFFTSTLPSSCVLHAVVYDLRVWVVLAQYMCALFRGGTWRNEAQIVWDSRFVATTFWFSANTHNPRAEREFLAEPLSNDTTRTFTDNISEANALSSQLSLTHLRTKSHATLVCSTLQFLQLGFLFPELPCLLSDVFSC